METETDVQAMRTPEAGPTLLSPQTLAGQSGSASKAAGIIRAAGALVNYLERGEGITRVELRQVMTEAFGGRTDAEGAWTWKLAYDAAEAALVLFLHDYGEKLLGTRAKRVTGNKQVERVLKIEALEPPETVRSETQVRLQQFSTPLPLALLAVRAAAIRPDDHVLEPSAGTGILAALAKLALNSNAGGRLTLNELGEQRAEVLELLFPGMPVTRHNAEHISDYLPSTDPTVVVMNPPFSRSPGMEQRRLDADVRHIRAAYQMLAPGGRLVTITAGSCAPWKEEWIEAFGRMQTPPSVAFTSHVDGSIYRRHGTTFDCRLTVLDRPRLRGHAPESIMDHAASARTAGELLELLDKRLRRRLDAERGTRKVRKAGPKPQTVMRKRKGAPRPVDPDDWGHCEDLVYDTVDEHEVEARNTEGGSYQPWRPEAIRVPHGSEHPTALVQSRAMAAVRHPKAVYRPKLPMAVTEKAMLSEAQLESVVLAGQALEKHQQTPQLISDDWEMALPIGDNGEVLDQESWSSATESGMKFLDRAVRFRQGWMLGDGTGAGKGRQVAAIILDNWLRGRTRAIWLSQSDKLIADAQRDWVAVGGKEQQIIPLKKVPMGDAIELPKGILFATYAALRSVSRSGKGTRLNQIVEWLSGSADKAAARNFQGVIVFDEAHAMAHAAPSTGSRGAIAPSAQGLAGLKLQNALPDARIIYVSATGASTIKGLAYANRLGLWSSGMTPFVRREEFIEAMESGGIASLEVVARDLKALGLYQARALSYEGVEIEIVEARLTTEQREIYDEYARAFGIIHKNLEKACELTGIITAKGKALNNSARAAAHSVFESTKQRFFNHLLTGMKVPTVIRRMERNVKDGHACVVQLVSTGEALMDRRIAQIPISEWNDLSVDLTPREYVLEYLQHSFPTQLHESHRDDEGNEYSLPVFDRENNPVASQEACAARDNLIEHLGSLAPVPTALDQLVHHFGTDAIAEITGRTRRIVRVNDIAGDRLKVDKRPANANLDEATAFMDDEKRTLIFSLAGGTGRSYHAAKDCRNQRRRQHYLLEAGWRADQAIQGLGRSHRTHQVSAPRVLPVSTDVKGERRFISTIAKRLDSLGAITRGQRNSQAAMGTEQQRLFHECDNFESDYALKALRQFYLYIVDGKVSGYSAKSFQALTGLRLIDGENSLLEKLPPMHQLLNRLLALEIDEQNRLFSVLEELINSNIEQAVEAGTYNQGVEELNADAFLKVKEEVLYTNSKTGAVTQLVELIERNRPRPMSAENALKKVGREPSSTVPGGLVINRRSKRAGIVSRATTWILEDGGVQKRVRVNGPTREVRMSLPELTLSLWQVAGAKEWEKAWQAEIDNLPEFEERRLWLVTGLLLPIWNRLPDTDMRVRRIRTEDGEALIGRMLNMGEVNRTLQQFGRDDAVRVSPDEVWTQLQEQGASFRLSEGLRLVKRRVMGIERVEIDHAHGNFVRTLRSSGCLTEMIAHSTRVFVPTLRTLGKVIRRYPLVSGGAVSPNEAQG